MVKTITTTTTTTIRAILRCHAGGITTRALTSLTAEVPRIAVVGGGITGTFASLVLKNRGLSPLLIDSGTSGVGGRLRGANRTKLGVGDAGAQFFRARDPKLQTVLSMLERSGMLTKWEGRFGLLGSQAGGFLPISVMKHVTGLPERDNNPENDDKEEQQEEIPAATDAGDFCGFVQNYNDTTTYVGVPNNADLCPQICSKAGIDVVGGTKVTKAIPNEDGSWQLQWDGNNNQMTEDRFDGLIMATHDPSFVASTVRSIVPSREEDKENVIQERLTRLADDLQAIRDYGRLPLFTWTGTFPTDVSAKIPFDAVSVPGSQKLQFLARDSSKRIIPSEGEEEVWNAVSTSAFAADVLNRLGASREASEEAAAQLSKEISSLLQSSERIVVTPKDASAARWASALTSKTLELKEDSILLAPWRFAIGGDYIQEKSSPFEAAALSGLEAGERVASLFQQTDEDQPQ